MRYINRDTMINEKGAYKRYLEKTRGISSIRQYNTAVFKYPSLADRKSFNSVNHIWVTGDRYFKLAEQYYGDPTLWWIIAFYNQKPTEFHIKMGDIIYIPVPLESVLFYLGY